MALSGPWRLPPCSPARSRLLLGRMSSERGQELREAADLHHDIGAPAGEALSLQRLAEVRLAQGDRTEANRLLQRALILARWSPMAPHLLQRTFGTMIEAASDAEAALAMVDRAEGALADRDLCPFCDVMLAVPAAIACSRLGDIERAHRYLRAAEGCVARPGGHGVGGRRPRGPRSSGLGRGRHPPRHRLARPRDRAVRGGRTAPRCRAMPPDAEDRGGHREPGLIGRARSGHVIKRGPVGGGTRRRNRVGQAGRS